MASRGQPINLTYRAYDTAASAPKTGDGANHTLRWLADNAGSGAALTTPTVTEVDATNLPGLYRVALTAAECDCNVGTLAGRSSTTGVYLEQVQVTFERLPTAAPGAANGLPQVGVSPLTNLDASISSRLAGSAYTAPDNATLSAVAGYLDTEVAAIKAKTDLLPAQPAAVGSAMSLPDGHLTDAKFAADGWVSRLYRRFFGRVRKDATTIKVYAADGTTVLTTQAYTSANGVDDLGAAS